MTLWITGATGFVGQALTLRLVNDGHDVVPVSRSAQSVCGIAAQRVAALGESVAPGDVVVYAAGRAHVQGRSTASSREAFRQANRDEPLAAARLASARGARRFVFVSSIKVNGEQTQGAPFSERDTPAPQDDYGRSKWEGEQALREHAEYSKMELVIVRPPLVYGPGVRANFAAMVRAVQRGLPLPLASVTNRRSLIYLGNLVDLLMLCCGHPAAAGRVVMASDGRDLSTPELLQMIGQALGKPARLWPCPESILKAGAGLLGRRALADRLCESLQVSDDFAWDKLMWRAPFSVEEGLRETVRWFVGEDWLVGGG